ncbi:unnamed protein product [Tuber aestivum]|uniref:Uncharacterized protein n=1 Tax=Tuber aestivum TaxID=59557 RepID=A0A292QA46_9PEZI|nr:unnamed protein product [Tuber aestivum]
MHYGNRWDSSDPARHPPPLPLNPGAPNSPRTVGTIQNPFIVADRASPTPISREISPTRRAPQAPPHREGSPSGPNISPTRAQQVMASHRRMNSMQPSPTVREMGNLILSGGSGSPSKSGTPTPKELFGSSTSFPAREQAPTPAPPPGYRNSLDLDRLPNLLPPLRNLKSHESMSATIPSSTLATTKDFKDFKEFKDLKDLKDFKDYSLPPLPRDRDGGQSEWESRNRDKERERDDGPKLSLQELETITSQLSGLTSIANSLQREMANLSRRSKDNATDLISLKEATKSRDEDIRQSLRDLVHGLHSLESDRLLTNSSLPLITSGASTSSRSSSYASDNFAASPGTRGEKSGLEMAALERVLREMSTKDEQDRVIDLLRDIQDTLNKPQLDRLENEEKIISLLEEFKERDYSKGKELAIPGRERDGDMDEKILSMLQNIRETLYQREEKESGVKIIGLLEELKQKGEEGENAQVISLLEELRGKKGGSGIDAVLASLEELKAKGGDEGVLSLLEGIKARMDSMKEDLTKSLSLSLTRRSPSSQDATGTGSAPDLVESDEILNVLKHIKQGVDSGEETTRDIQRLIDEWKERWAGHDREAHEALKDLMKEVEILVTEQRQAISRLHSNPGLQSTALTMTNPPLPPDLDNEAAITALANIASTTTRTDITLSTINALIKVFHKDMNSANTHTHETVLNISRFLQELGNTVSNAHSQTGETRKLLEVVRSGVSSGNDRLAEFEGAALRKIEELMFLHKHLQKTMLTNGDEMIWKQDVGVRAVVEEFQSEVEELLEKNMEAVKESAEKAVEAINNSNPVSLIGELKNELGAMAQRSLAAFAAADSKEALAELKSELQRATEQSVEAINTLNPGTSIEEFRAEVKEILEKILSTSESSSNGLTKLEESTPTQAVIGDLKRGLEELIERSFNTSNEQTGAAIANMKSVIADKTESTEKIQTSIDQLKAVVTELMEKSVTALAPPTSYPEAESIKARIESLALEITKTMDNTIALFSDSSVETDEKLKKAVDELKAELGEMSKSIPEAVSSNSASGLEGVVKEALDEMKEVVGRIEKRAEVERPMIPNPDASEKMTSALEDLKKEVHEMVEKSINMAVGTPQTGEPAGKVQEAIEGLRADITSVMEKSLVAASGSDNFGELLEDLRKEIAEMLEKSASMIVPHSNSDEATRELLGEIKKDVASILAKSPPSESSSDDVEEAIGGLRKEVGELMDKTMSMIAPRATDTEGPPPRSAERIEGVLKDLKSEIGEMVQQSLAAAIANSTFDSEESVKEVIEELKRDIRDTLQLSMMPLPAENTEAAERIRTVLQGFKTELGELFETKIAVPNVTIMEVIDSLRVQVGVLAENPKDGAVAEIMEELKMLVEGLGQGGSGGGVVESIGDLRKGMGLLAEKLDASSPAEVTSAIEGLKREVEQLSGKSGDAFESLKLQVEGLGIKETIEALKAQVEGLSGISGVPVPFGQPAASNEEIKESMESLKRDIEEVMEKSMGSLVASKPDDTEVREWIGALKEEMVVYVEKSVQAAKATNPSEAIDGLRREIREAMSRSGHHIPHEPERTQVGEKVEKIKEAFEELRKVVEKNSGTDPATKSTLEEGVETIRMVTDGMRHELNNFRAEEKEAIVDVNSAIGECRVEVAVVKTLVDEKHTEIRDSITGFAAAVDESNTDLKSSITAVHAVVEALQNSSNEAATGVADSVAKLRTETHDGIIGVNLSLSDTKEGISGISSGISEVHHEVKGGNASISGAISETKEMISSFNETVTCSSTGARQDIDGVRNLVEALKNETSAGFVGITDAVETAASEVMEVVSALTTKTEASQTNLSGLKAIIEESQATNKSALTDINTSIEERATEVREDVFAVKKAVEESSITVSHEHRKTQKQVEDVLGLVDGLHSELKGQQPTLLSALLELKNLLQEANKEIAKKSDIDAIPPPPAYDDSQTQEKLNTLISGNTSAAKYLPQLSLLDSIQKQVTTTSADIAEFLSMQKEVLLEDTSSKIDAARQAEMDLEIASAEREIVKAAAASLREEHASLQNSVEALKEETSALFTRKLKLTGEVASLETALDLRRDELMLLEARAEGLERRVVEGVIEQSRALLMKPKGNSSRSSKADTSTASRKTHSSPAVKPSTNGRRNLSLNEVQSDSPTLGTSSKSGRTSLTGSTLGLGQKEYSASLGLLKRSQSTKSVGSSERRKNSWGQKLGRAFSGTGGKENSDGVLPTNEEEAGEYDADEIAEGDDDMDAELERLMREQEESDFADGRRGSSGSVRRMAANERGEEQSGSEAGRKSKAYPALGLDFSDEPMSRSISGVSTGA